MPDINVNKLSETLNTKADIDLNNTGVFSTSGGWVNLTSSTPANASGKEVTTADFIKSDIQSNLLNYTTNRILEIPQDIKLELNNGTLTLKAGSKVYVPNGVGTFKAVTITSDVSTARTDSQDCILWYNTDNGTIQLFPSILFYSGATAPSGYQFMFWYDITNNKCKVTSTSGSTWVEGKSFPICVVSTDGIKISAIKQIFNGFGYIGSTLFLLPGVKTVVPDGRNEDGTCKNKAPSTVASVKTETISRAVSAYMFTNFVSSVIATHHYVCSKTKPIVTETTLWYNPETNLPSQVLSDGTVMTPYEEIPIAKFTSDSTGKITSFDPFTVDSIVNSNEFYQLRDKAVTTNTAQTISGTKRFTQPSAGMSIELVADTNQQTVPAEPKLRQLGLYRNATYTKGDGYTCWLQGLRGSDGWTATELYARRFLESDSQEIINYLRVNVTPEGVPISYTKTPPANSAGEEIVTAGWVRNAFLFPGEIIIWSAPTPPAGYLICDGSAISRTTYARLFQVIGTTWGAGDGNTTFNLPSFGDRYPVGFGSLGAVGTLLNQGLPNITGQFQVVAGANVDNPSGCFYFNTNSPIGYSRTGGDGGTTYPTAISASRSSNVYGSSDRVQPFSSIVNFCIRY